MKRRTVLPMESYRLAPYAVPVPCYICGEGNKHDNETCRFCGAPMALAHQAAVQKLRPYLLSVLGAPNAGKTTYLGLLVHMLSRPNQHLQMTARGAVSVAVQMATIQALSHDHFPPPTPRDSEDWNWLHCQVKSAHCRRPVELIMPDMSGEALRRQLYYPGAYPLVRELLATSAAALMLIDASKLRDGTGDEELFAIKLMNYLYTLNHHRRKGWPNRPIAVALTKVDQCLDCRLAPADFLRKQAPSLWQLCGPLFKCRQFFAVSVAGACANRWQSGQCVQIPLRIEPYGVVEPFAWLIEQLV